MVAYKDNLGLYFYHAKQYAGRWPQFDISELIAECWLRNRGNMPGGHKGLAIRRDMLDYIRASTGIRHKSRVSVNQMEEDYDAPDKRSFFGDIENKDLIENILSRPYLTENEKQVLKSRLGGWIVVSGGPVYERPAGMTKNTTNVIFHNAVKKIREIERVKNAV